MKKRNFRLCLPFAMLAFVAATVITSCTTDENPKSDLNSATRTTVDSTKLAGISINVHDEWDGDTLVNIQK